MKTNIRHTFKTIVTSRMTIMVGALLTLALGTSVLAYGPERPTYTVQNAAPHITFNSITNNEAYGDERDFMTVKDTSLSGPGNWKNTIQVQHGKEYWVRVLVHNNAKSQLNLTATNTRVAVSVPTMYSNSITLDGFVSSNNSSPKEVWDNAVMTNDKKFNVGYVTGSARYYNNIKPTEGFALSDNIVTNSGALVGYQSMDGNVKGCYEFSGYAIFKVKVTVTAPDFTVDKSVRIHGTTDWKKSITAKPGQKVDYQIAYDNVGNSNQLNVTAQDTLPKGVKYVSGSTTVKNIANPTGDGLKINSNNLVTSKGINIGSYAPNSNALVRFSAVLPSNSKLACGPNKLINTATVATQNGEKSDVASVTITKQCATALPTTGPIEVIAGLVGVSAITFGVVYYMRSRQELDQAVMHAQTSVKVGKSHIDHPTIHHHDK